MGRNLFFVLYLVAGYETGAFAFVELIDTSYFFLENEDFSSTQTQVEEEFSSNLGSYYFDRMVFLSDSEVEIIIDQPQLEFDTILSYIDYGSYIELPEFGPDGLAFEKVNGYNKLQQCFLLYWYYYFDDVFMRRDISALEIGECFSSNISENIPFVLDLNSPPLQPGDTVGLNQVYAVFSP